MLAKVIASIASVNTSMIDMLNCTHKNFQEVLAMPSNWTYTLFESKIPASALI